MGSCHSKDSHCVRNILKEIIRAQNEVADHCCDTSCEQSIRDLISPSTGNGNTTVPFVLYCKDCKPFFASGLKKKASSHGYHCIETPVFKAKKFVDDNCVKLELLKPVHHHGGHSWHKCDKKSVCSVLDDVVSFQSTGICTTVDVSCFCGITCLDATTPEPFSPTAARTDLDESESYM
ncbi:spore coat protein [Halobacillus litoralis]|uniref:CotY/CotZ family spore coat protein n=1 Tax=Halobacillus litoralis TaxID=45668 RepID=UPI001CD41B2A|nr:CotY/CotZ family spore coat protein [Halobacillus litoralis]MCA0971969.1 spore coat protein [Halobacillus litoralis]